MASSSLKLQFQAMDQQLIEATNKGLQIPEVKARFVQFQLNR